MTVHDRREFLGLLTGGVAASAALPVLSPATAPPSTWPDRRASLLAARGAADEAYWTLVKREFPIRPGLIMMNAANLCPSPYPVIETVTQLTRDIDTDASFQNRGKFGALREHAREAIAAHVGADPAEIAITRNTSESNNTVVNGLTLGSGDEVVIWDQNHPTNNTSWEVRAQRMGFTVKKVATPAAPSGPEELVAIFADALSRNTKILSFTHVSSGSGMQLPARDLCRMARDRGILTLVDGAQSFGAIHLDLHDMGCDFFTSSSHKWFVGPKEAGILYVRQDQIANLWANDVGVGWSGALANGARKFESLGQRDDACVAAMGTTAEFHRTIGADLVEARVRSLTTALMDKMKEKIAGVVFTTPTNPDLRAGVLIFSVPGTEGRELFGRLYEEKNIASAPRGARVRLSAHIYNTMDEVDRVVEAIADLV